MVSLETLPEIRHLAAAPDSPIVLAAEYARIIYALSLRELKFISVFRTILDWGGSRMAVAHDGSLCVVGNYFEGVALYEIISGTEIWRRPDLKQVQYIAMGRDRKTIFCGFEQGPGRVICTATGQTLRLLRGVQKLYESSSGEVSVWQERKACRIQNTWTRTSARVGIRSSIRDIAFFSDRLCIAGNALHGYGEDGIAQWEVALPEGQRVTNLRFLPNGRLFGVVRNFESDTLHLVEFNGKTGEPAPMTDLGTAELAVFCFEDKLLCSDGTLWDVASGSFIRSVWKWCPQAFIPEDRRRPSRKTGGMYTIRCTALQKIDGPMPQLGSYPTLEAALKAIEDFRKRHAQLAEMSLVLHGVQVTDPSGKVVWDGVKQGTGRPSKDREN